MTTQFTPGPWDIKYIDTNTEQGDAIVGPYRADQDVEIVTFLGPNTSDANARLLVAAPDLYEAVQAFRTVAGCFCYPASGVERGFTSGTTPYHDDRCNTARDALAKVDGHE